MTIAILATGDEIIHGDTLNTNTHYIAHALCSEGLPLGLQMACSDKENEIIDSLNFLTEHHDILILIGGLGTRRMILLALLWLNLPKNLLFNMLKPWIT